MTKNEYICSMLKSEEHSHQILVSQLNAEKRARRAAEKKVHDADLRISDLTMRNSDLESRLESQLNKVTEMVQQIATMLMGGGALSLPESLKEELVGTIRKEFECQVQTLKSMHEKEKEELLASFKSQLAARDNEIARLKGEDVNGDDQSPSSPGPNGSAPATLEEMSARNRQLEQQRANLQVTSYGQHIESGKYLHGQQQTENADDLDLNGEDVPAEKVVEIAKVLKQRKDMKGQKKPRREQPLVELVKESKDEIELIPEGLPSDAEYIGEDVTVRYAYVKGYVRTFVIRRKKYKDPRGCYYHVNLPSKYQNCMGRTQVTESLIAQILTMHFYYNMTIADIEGWLQGMGLNFAHTTVINWIRLGAEILAPLDEPLHQAIITSGEAHGDESTLGCKDKRLPDKDEKAEDVEDDLHYFKRWIFCYYAPLYSLTQFVFHERGRRTQEAVKKYFEDVMDKLYLHSDGAPIYKCYDVGELILRIACLVHMRRPFFKLKEFSKDAMLIMKLFDTIFHEDKKIKEKFSDPEDIRRERCACLGPLFNDLKNYLDRLGRNLKKEDEPELLKAVNYALKEYPCMLRCLEDGSLDLSNNICERQIRRIAKYRNNSLFVGSPESGVRFARLMSVFANIRNHHLDPIEYLCDVFRRIGTLAKEKLVDLLPHRWQPVTVPAWV